MPPIDDLVSLVRAQLLDRVPIDDAERASIERVLVELDRLPDPFSETAGPVHVTGSAIVTGPRGVVLLRHRLLGIWLQPGGHMDPGETPWQGALREATEETGLELAFSDGVPRLVHVDVHAGGKGHTHLDLRYLLVAGDADPSPPSGESQEVEWLDWDAAIERAGDDRLRAALSSLRH